MRFDIVPGSVFPNYELEKVVVRREIMQSASDIMHFKMNGFLEHGAGSPRLRIFGIYCLLFLFIAGSWFWAVMAFHRYPVLLRTTFLADSLGLRHAVDADHIAVIDSVTRKLMQAVFTFEFRARIPSPLDQHPAPRGALQLPYLKDVGARSIPFGCSKGVGDTLCPNSRIDEGVFEKSCIVSSPPLSNPL